jgi:hypothetical protein
MPVLLSWIGFLILVLSLLLLGRSAVESRRRRRYLEAEFPKLASQNEKSAVNHEEQVTAPNNTRAQSGEFPALPRRITNSNEESVDRVVWVQRLTDHVFRQRHSGRYNVLTVNTKVWHRFLPEEVVERMPVTYTNSKTLQVIHYEVCVFQKGTMTLLGDGGYINWCFEGNFNRMENHVEFNPLPAEDYLGGDFCISIQ